MRPPTRRALVDRWIVRLQPMITVITDEAHRLGLPEPHPFGPTYFPRRIGNPEHIRTGTVWWLTHHGNSGFHVDFYATAVRIEAWTGRHLRTHHTDNREPGPQRLRDDLHHVLALAGLTDPTTERADG